MGRSLVVVSLVSLVLGGVAVADHHVKVTELPAFTAGPLPGAPTIVIKAKPAKDYCGGVALSAKIKKSKKLSAPDKELAAVFALSFPTGLDFDPSHALASKNSTKKFDAWFKKFSDASQAAADRYSKVIGDSTAPLDRVIGAARQAQVAQWSAHIIARGQVPKSVAKYPDAVDIYCDTLEDKAEPLLAFAIEAATRCRDLAASANVGAGWWDAVCAP